MKIAVLGNIIDTDNIYKISPIKLPTKEDYFYEISFTIESFNQKILDISIRIGWMYTDGIVTLNSNTLQTDNELQKNNITFEELINSKVHITAFKEITRIRKFVIEHWNNGNSSYPRIKSNFPNIITLCGV